MKCFSSHHLNSFHDRSFRFPPSSSFFNSIHHPLEHPICSPPHLPPVRFSPSISRVSEELPQRISLWSVISLHRPRELAISCRIECDEWRVYRIIIIIWLKVGSFRWLIDWLLGTRNRVSLINLIVEHCLFLLFGQKRKKKHCVVWQLILVLFVMDFSWICLLSFINW